MPKVKKVDFLIDIEIKSREIEPYCLLKLELERRGYNVAITDFTQMQIASGLTYDAEVLISGGILYYGNIGYALGKGVRFQKQIRQPWEQVSARELLKAQGQNYDDIGKGIVVLAWGDKPKERFCKKEAINPDNIFVTGHPTLDFCKMRFRRYYWDKETVGKKASINPEKKWCLFISSFFLKDNDEKDRELADLNSGWKFFTKTWQAEMDTKAILFSWFENMLSQHEDIIFVYRPHPTEKVDPRLIELLHNYKNFRIIRDYDIKQWLWVADFIYTWISTSSVEAYFMNKPCYVLRPVEIDSDIDIEIYNNKSVFIDSYEKFENTLYGEFTEYPFTEEMIRKFYYYDENKYAYEIVADICEEVYKNDTYVISQVVKDKIERVQDTISQGSLKTLIKNNLRKTAIYDIYHMLMGKRVPNRRVYESEIEDIERRLRECLQLKK